jgi:hypothetical protein
MRLNHILLVLAFALVMKIEIVQGGSQGNTGQTSTSSAPSKSIKPKTSMALSRNYREAAMLARIAIVNYQVLFAQPHDKSGPALNEAEKAVTIAKARAITVSDTKMNALVLALYDNVLLEDKYWMVLTLSHAKYEDSLEGRSVKEVMEQFHQCNTYLEKALDAGKYEGPGPCKTLPDRLIEAATKP